MTAAAVESRLRRLLLLATFTLAATSVELWLEEHTKVLLQFVPFFLCGVGRVTLVAALLCPHKTTLMPFGLRCPL